MGIARIATSVLALAALTTGATAQTYYTPTSYQVTLYKVAMSTNGSIWRSVLDNSSGVQIDLANPTTFANAFGAETPIPVGSYKWMRMEISSTLVWSHPAAPVSLSNQPFIVVGGPPGPQAGRMLVYFATHDQGGRPNMPNGSGGEGTVDKPFLLGAGAEIAADTDTTLRIVFAVTDTLKFTGTYDLQPPEMFFVTENGAASTLSGTFNTVLYNAEKKFSASGMTLTVDDWNYMSGHGLLTFDGNGGWTWAGTTNDFDLQTPAGALDNGAAYSGRYGVNDDGSFWMIATGQPGTMRGAKSTDGKIIFASMYDSPSAHMMVFGVERATAAAVGTMNGGYYFTVYGSRYNTGSSELKYSGTFGVVTGDGLGGVNGNNDSNEVAVTNPTATPTFTAPATSLASPFADTLTVNPNGTISNAAELAGGILESGDAAAIAFSFNPVYQPNNEFGFLVRQSPASTFTNASLNGTYFGGHFGDVYKTGVQTTVQYFSGFFKITFNGDGTASVTVLENREGVVETQTFAQNYSVDSATGIVTFSDPNGGPDSSLKGAIGPNAMSFILASEAQVNGAPSDQRFLGLGLKQ